MEQSNNGGNEVRSYDWSRDEREVAETLLGMNRMMLDLDSDLRVPFQWGRKRKRSAINASVLPSPSPTTKALPKALMNNGGGGGVAAAVLKAEAAEASSPATPLSLSLTESEEKKPLRTKASLKKKREYYLKIMEDLTKSKASLNQEIDNVKRHYEQLKAFNLKLKERKQELSDDPKSECKINPSLGIGIQMQQQQQQLVHAQVNPSNSEKNQHHQFQLQLQQVPPSTQHFLRLKPNNTSASSQLCTSSNEGIAQFQNLSMLSPPPPPPPSSSSSSLPMVNISSSNNVGPNGVPDLNASPEELIQVDSYQPLDVNVTIANKDVSRAMAAKARQRRIQIYRLKNSIGNSKPRYSCR